MQSKVQYYAELAENHIGSITASRESWTEFLETVGRLYKYPFEEQLMIHAQRPEAQACASFDVWNDIMNRHIKRGSSGIALLDNSGNRPKLKYVFDYADTEDGRQNPRRPYLWQMLPEHENIVMEALLESYVSDGTDKDIGNILFELAQNLSAIYYEDNKEDIQYSVDSSYLENFDEYDIAEAFRAALTVSTSYALMSRCGIDPLEYLHDEDFLPIFDFNSPTAVIALGNGVSDVTEEVLRDIEVIIKNHERNNTAERNVANERNNILEQRGLPVSEHSDDGGSDERTGQVWDDEESLSERTQTDTVFDAISERSPVSPLSGNRADSVVTDGTYDGAIDETITATRENIRPDSVDSTHEQPESFSGGSNPSGTYLQLEESDNHEIQEDAPSEFGGVSDYMLQSDDVELFALIAAMPMLPTEAEQLETILVKEEADIASQPKAITQEDIDKAINDWNGNPESKMRVYGYMLNNGRARNTADWLKSEYGDSLSLFPIRKENAETIELPWENIQRRIGQLIELGEFVLHDAETNEPGILKIPLKKRQKH